MKISVVVGGKWHAFELAQHLNSVGILHRLITTHPKCKTREYNIPDSKVISLPLSLLISKSLRAISGEVSVMKSQYFLHSIFAQSASSYLEGSTLIHGWSSFSEPSMIWARHHQVPFILERSSAHMAVQCQLVSDEYEKLGLSFQPTHPEIVAQEIREYGLADLISIPSSFVKKSFISKGFDKDKLFYSPLGVSLNSFSPQAKEDEVFRVVYAGALNVRKGIHYLMDAFIKANISNSELSLLGASSSDTSALLSKADERVKCSGHVSQSKLASYYSRSSVFVMPSIEDGFGMVVPQAMSCGLPIICTTNTGGEDLLKMSNVQPIPLAGGINEYPAGYVVPICDSDAIATCLKMLANDKDLLLSKQKSALALRSQGLSWSHYGDRAIKCYQTMHQNYY